MRIWYLCESGWTLPLKTINKMPTPPPTNPNTLKRLVICFCCSSKKLSPFFTSIWLTKVWSQNEQSRGHLRWPHPSFLHESDQHPAFYPGSYLCLPARSTLSVESSLICRLASKPYARPLMNRHLTSANGSPERPGICPSPHDSSQLFPPSHQLWNRVNSRLPARMIGLQSYYLQSLVLPSYQN
jgi:hypothetical protein